jgi:hypothetical protein
MYYTNVADYLVGWSVIVDHDLHCVYRYNRYGNAIKGF